MVENTNRLAFNSRFIEDTMTADALKKVTTEALDTLANLLDAGHTRWQASSQLLDGIFQERSRSCDIARSGDGAVRVRSGAFEVEVKRRRLLRLASARLLNADPDARRRIYPVLHTQGPGTAAQDSVSD